MGRIAHSLDWTVRKAGSVIQVTISLHKEIFIRYIYLLIYIFNTYVTPRLLIIAITCNTAGI